MIVEQGEDREQLRLVIEEQDDLWTLAQVLEKGDQVRTKTRRRLEERAGVMRGEDEKRVKVTLTLSVTKVEFAVFTDNLRVSGTITAGPDHVPRGDHHTFTLKPGDRLKVWKTEWDDAHMEELKAASDRKKRAKAWFLSLEDHEAFLYSLHTYGLWEYAYINRSMLGKYDGGRGARDSKKDFFDEIILQLKEITSDSEIVLFLLGPGFTPEEFFQHARQKSKAVVEDAIVTSTTNSGRRAVFELLQREEIEERIGEHRLQKEIVLFEKFLAALASDDEGTLATFGRDHVKRALDLGAVETLLISTNLIKKRLADDYIDLARATGAEHHLISADHEAGERLWRIGGVAAILRFDIGE